MLVHIVCWKYKSEVAEEQREDHRAKLRALAGIIPEVISLECGKDTLNLPRSYDTGLTSTFADRAALDTYINHPDHQVVVAFGKEISENVVSVDFVTE
jgi:hypothetical protein